MSRVTPIRQQQQTAQQDPWTTSSHSQNPSGHIPYGLSILTSLSTMSFQQEASVGQGKSRKVSQRMTAR